MLGLKKRILPVHTYGSPVLKVVEAPVMGITPEIRKLAEQMIETMFAFDGVGLAAPQVGVSQRLITLGLTDKLPKDYVPSPGELQLLPLMPLALINPIIISYGAVKECREEGCLSVPDIWAVVERPERIVVQMEIIGYGPVAVECGGLLARCIQHEMDHIDGKLFIDRLATEVLAEVKEPLNRLYEQGRNNQFQRSKK